MSQLTIYLHLVQLVHEFIFTLLVLQLPQKIKIQDRIDGITYQMKTCNFNPLCRQAIYILSIICKIVIPNCLTYIIQLKTLNLEVVGSIFIRSVLYQRCKRPETTICLQRIIYTNKNLENWLLNCWQDNVSPK